MSRVLAIVLFLTGLSLVAPPAHAAVSVTISASPSTLVVGGQTVIKGKVVNAKPGSVVKLQRKVDGTWRAVTSKQVWSARTYSFAIKPTRGVHTYRVVKPRQLGQPYAASPTVKVTVTGPLSVTISASPTSLTVGSTTTISGKAVNGLPGSVVQLQHRVDGSWQQVASKKVWSARTYSFVVTPAEGGHSYRVVKPRQLGQPYAASPAAAVQVIPAAPELVVNSSAGVDDQGRDILIFTGRVSGFPEAWVGLEYRWGAEGRWSGVTYTRAEPDGTFELRNRDWAYAQFRVVAPAFAGSPELISHVFVSAQQPYRLPLNGEVQLTGLHDEHNAGTVLLDVEAGDEVTFAGPTNGNWGASVAEPDGSFVGGIRPVYDDDLGRWLNMFRFEAEVSGTYVVDVTSDSEGQSVTLWASTPKTVMAVVDGPSVAVANDFPYQIVDVEFDIPAGQAYTLNDGYSGEWSTALLDPDGAEEGPWIKLPESYDVIYRADTPGTHLYRHTPDSGNITSTTLSVVAATTLAGTVDGPELLANVDVPYRAVLIPVEMPAGGFATADDDADHFSIVTVDAATGAQASLGSAGSRVVVVTADQRQVGTARVHIRSAVKVSATVDGDPTAVESSGPRRIVEVSFEGKAGQVVTAAVSRGASPGYLYVSDLSGPDGQPRRDLFGDMWHLPADGTYVLRGQTEGEFVGSVAVASKEQLALPADGTPVEFVIDEPREVIVARIPVAAGTLLDVTLDQIDPSLGDDWNVGLYAPDGYWYNTWIRPGTLPRITVREDGDVYAIITADSDALGSVRLTATPFTP